MSNLMENYEQQYAVLTADITSRIGKLKRTPTGEEYYLANAYNQ